VEGWGWFSPILGITRMFCSEISICRAGRTSSTFVPMETQSRGDVWGFRFPSAAVREQLGEGGLEVRWGSEGEEGTVLRGED